MLRDITLGQYYPADSVVHKLDPRVKLFATMIYIIALFTFRGILGFAIITGMLIFMIKISNRILPAEESLSLLQLFSN